MTASTNTHGRPRRTHLGPRRVGHYIDRDGQRQDARNLDYLAVMTPQAVVEHGHEAQPRPKKAWLPPLSKKQKNRANLALIHNLLKHRANQSLLSKLASLRARVAA